MSINYNLSFRFKEISDYEEYKKLLFKLYSLKSKLKNTILLHDEYHIIDYFDDANVEEDGIKNIFFRIICENENIESRELIEDLKNNTDCLLDKINKTFRLFDNRYVHVLNISVNGLYIEDE